MTARLLAACVATVGVLVAGLCGAAPAHADIGYVTSPDTSATVTHLNLLGRSGSIGATITVGSRDRVIGMVVDIPAAGGTWKTAAKVTLRAGITCTGGGGTDPLTDPLYSCLTPLRSQYDEFHKDLPVGRFLVTLPISRPTGTLRGLTGTVGVTRPDAWSPAYASSLDDTFPVLSPTIDKQSSAELSNLYLGTTFTGRLYAGDVKLHVIVKPGEQVTGVYVTLPTAANGVTAYTARQTPSGHGPTCGEDQEHAAPPNTFVLSCVEPSPHNGAWPAGVYSLSVLVAGLVADAGNAGVATADVAYLGGERHTVDTAYVVPDDYYRAPSH